MIKKEQKRKEKKNFLAQSSQHKKVNSIFAIKYHNGKQYSDNPVIQKVLHFFSIIYITKFICWTQNVNSDYQWITTRCFISWHFVRRLMDLRNLFSSWSFCYVESHFRDLSKVKTQVKINLIWSALHLCQILLRWKNWIKSDIKMLNHAEKRMTKQFQSHFQNKKHWFRSF